MFYDGFLRMCNERGTTPTAVIKALSLSTGSIGAWKQGRTPTTNTLKKLADYFRVEVDDFFAARENEVIYDKVPVLSEVAGGIPIQAMDIFDPQDPDSWEEVEKNAKRGGEYFGLKIHGNSMYPRIMDGDIVIVRKQETVDDGQTAIVTVNGENGTCKKVKYRPDGVMLISTNPEVEPLFFTHKEVRDLPVRIIGRVVKVHGDI